MSVAYEHTCYAHAAYALVCLNVYYGAMTRQTIHLYLPDPFRSEISRLAVIEDRTIVDMIRRLLKEALAAREIAP